MRLLLKNPFMTEAMGKVDSSPVRPERDAIAAPAMTLVDDPNILAIFAAMRKKADKELAAIHALLKGRRK